jgi:hypothetical protein
MANYENGHFVWAVARRLAGKDMLLLAGSNAEATDLARVAQAQFIAASPDRSGRYVRGT